MLGVRYAFPRRSVGTRDAGAWKRETRDAEAWELEKSHIMPKPVGAVREPPFVGVTPQIR